MENPDPREPESAATARRSVRVALAVWGLDDRADDGALIVSELVSNAVQHARRESIRLTVDRPGTVRVGFGSFDNVGSLRDLKATGRPAGS